MFLLLNLLIQQIFIVPDTILNTGEINMNK